MAFRNLRMREYVCVSLCVSLSVSVEDAPLHPSVYANLVTTRMGGLSPEEIALLMSMLDDNGDGEISCAARSHSLSCHKIFLVPPVARIS